MPQFFLAVHTNPGATLTAQQVQEANAAIEVFNALLKQHGVWVFAGGLQPLAQEVVVDATHEQVSVSPADQGGDVEGIQADQACDYVSGFWVIRVDDRDAAVHWASKASAACGCSVHVRPFVHDQA